MRGGRELNTHFTSIRMQCKIITNLASECCSTVPMALTLPTYYNKVFVTSSEIKGNSVLGRQDAGSQYYDLFFSVGDGGQPVMSVPSPPAQTGMTQWTCNHCTFINESANNSCEMCGLPQAQPVFACTLSVIFVLITLHLVIVFIADLDYIKTAYCRDFMNEHDDYGGLSIFGVESIPKRGQVYCSQKCIFGKFLSIL